jgi:hypothetical protein
MKKTAIMLILLAVSTLANNVFAQNGKSVQRMILDVDVTAEFLTVSSDNKLNKVKMDKSDQYEHNVDGVKAQFFANSGNLTIQLLNSQRYVWFDLSQVSNGINAPKWVSNPQLVQPTFNVLNAYKAKENCLSNTGIYNCNFKTSMTASNWKVNEDAFTYAFLWNPETTGNKLVNHPERTSYVNINYFKGVDGKEVFTIYPIANCATPVNNFNCRDSHTDQFTNSNYETVSWSEQYIMPFTSDLDTERSITCLVARKTTDTQYIMPFTEDKSTKQVMDINSEKFSSFGHYILPFNLVVRPK